MPQDEFVGKKLYEAIRNTEPIRCLERCVYKPSFGQYLDNIKNFVMKMGETYESANNPECIQRISSEIMEYGGPLPHGKGALNLTEDVIQKIVEQNLKHSDI